MNFTIQTPFGQVYLLAEMIGEMATGESLRVPGRNTHRFQPGRNSSHDGWSAGGRSATLESMDVRPVCGLLGIVLGLAACGGTSEERLDAGREVQSPDAAQDAGAFDADRSEPDTGSSDDAGIDDATTESPDTSVASCVADGDGDDITPGPDRVAPCGLGALRREVDLAYTDDEGLDGAHRLDLYRPDGDGPFPTVIWVHGGGWRSGDKNSVNQPMALACRGFALVSINYRLSGEALFPAQIQDVKAAVRFLRAHAAEYRLDAERFAVFGSSAGGHLAALLGTSGGVSDFEDETLGNPGFSSRVQAVVDWYGPIDFLQMDAQAREQGCRVTDRHASADSSESALLGCTVADASCAPAIERANPITYISTDAPPFLIMHGTDDCLVPRGQSTLLANALRDSGVCVTERSVVGARHGGPEWITAAPQEVVAEFLERALR